MIMVKFTLVLLIFSLVFSCSTIAAPYTVSSDDEAEIIIRRVDNYDNIDIGVRIQYDCFDYQLNTKSWPGKEFRVSQRLSGSVIFGAKNGNYRIGAYLNDDSGISSPVMDFKIKNDRFIFDIEYIPADPNSMRSLAKIDIAIRSSVIIQE
jgi:hypothetical protein